MSYQIHITQTAKRDMMNAADYIEYTLKNPKAANDLLGEAKEKISHLSEFPQKFPLVDDPILASWKIRYVIIKGYLAFYTFSEDTQKIIIVRFLFHRSNWNSILNQGFPLI